MGTAKRSTIIIKHQHFTVYVSCDDIQSPLEKLNHTYEQRHADKPVYGEVTVAATDHIQQYMATFEDNTPITQPFFFENRQYWFEVEFQPCVDRNSAAIQHKHRLIEDAFYLNRSGNALQASINFGNDVGRCYFTISYQMDGVVCTVDISFTIFATKMVLAQDLELINRSIDSVYPLWRYSLSSKTSLRLGESTRNKEKFELFWLAQFERLVRELQLGVKQVLNAPHNRLQSFSKQQKLDRVSKRLRPKQAEKAKQLINAGAVNARVTVNYKKLDVDTPENRFVKMVINYTSSNLATLLRVIESEKKAKLSDSFIASLQSWNNHFSRQGNQQLWREVGKYNSISCESKVLQQGTGYAKVYKVWQQLKHYLNKVNGRADIAVKSIAELYEIWCFVEVMEIVKSLGFVEQTRQLAKLKQVQFEKQFSKDGMAAAFEFVRTSDDMVIKLAHEPTFSPKGKENRTWLANQRPDIVLQVILANDESFFILFDAKYRIDKHQINGIDAVPEDAINQMHRYRDAIIHQQQEENDNPLKSRPVMGAFALYPGFCTQEITDNPYQDAIDQIGIGAFALLPSDNNKSSHKLWLKNYLEEKLGGDVADKQQRSHDYYFVDDAARITPYGQSAIRYSGLTMVVPLNEIGRDIEYLQDARGGLLKGYHTQLLATNRQNVHRNIIREVRYLVISVRENDEDDVQVGKYLYTVNNIKLLPRRKIERSKTGKDSNEEKLFWIFEFADQPIALKNKVVLPYEEHFKFKLTKAEYLSDIKHWGDITGKYQLYENLNGGW